MKVILGRSLRRVAGWLFRVADWVEGVEVIFNEAINLEPEHALKALRDASAARAAASSLADEQEQT